MAKQKQMSVADLRAALEKEDRDRVLVAVIGGTRTVIEQEPIETETDEADDNDEYEVAVEFCPKAYDASYPPVTVGKALKKLARYDGTLMTLVTDQGGGCESLLPIVAVKHGAARTVELHAGRV